MVMDFEAIADFWLGDLPEPELPFEPINLGAGFSNETVELRDPLEELPEENPKENPSEETPEPEEED